MFYCSGGFRGGAGAPIILGQHEEITEGRKAGRVFMLNKIALPPPLSSRSGCATGTSMLTNKFVNILPVPWNPFFFYF